MTMMDLRVEPPVPIKGMQPTHGEFDPDAFQKFCLEFGFHSILNDFARFMKPFFDHQKSLNTEVQ